MSSSAPDDHQGREREAHEERHSNNTQSKERKGRRSRARQEIAKEREKEEVLSFQRILRTTTHPNNISKVLSNMYMILYK